MSLQVKVPLTFFITLFAGYLSAAELVNITPEQLQFMQKQNALVIDIRTEQEWVDTGTIPKSLKMQFFDKKGNFDSEQWLMQLNEYRNTSDQPVILVCGSGNRSARVGNFLTQKLGMSNIYHLQGGMNVWLKQGKKTEQGCPKQTPC